MDGSLAKICRYKYNQIQSLSPFSGHQTYKDKSFNLKLRLIKETNFPELSIRDFIGTGKFFGEYIVSSKELATLILQLE